MKVRIRLDDGMGQALDRMSRLAEDAIYSGAAAMARVIYDEVRINTSGLEGRRPRILTGALHESIYMAKDEDASTRQRAVYAISWNRTKAPHGHLVEFGTSRAPAYPFVTPAAGKLPEAVRAGKLRMAEVIAAGKQKT